MARFGGSANCLFPYPLISPSVVVQDTLKARAQSAKSAKAVQEMVSGLGTSNALANFERMEEKVMKMEAEADATMMLSGGDALAQEFAMLEAGR
jgi:phage shock protein A